MRLSYPIFRLQNYPQATGTRPLAAIIYWQIREIDTVLRHWDPEDEGIDPALLPHISPIGWDNVILYGEYALDPGWVRHPHGIPQHRVENFA